MKRGGPEIGAQETKNPTYKCQYMNVQKFELCN